jgi:hypothetical protein
MQSHPATTGNAVSLTYREAALEVLRSARRPLTAREITDRALERGLIVPHGRTPLATMQATLYRSVRDDARLVKLDTPGVTRAVRGSVRWTVASR